MMIYALISSSPSFYFPIFRQQTKRKMFSSMIIYYFGNQNANSSCTTIDIIQNLKIQFLSPCSFSLNNNKKKICVYDKHKATCQHVIEKSQINSLFNYSLLTNKAWLIGKRVRVGCRESHVQTLATTYVSKQNYFLLLFQREAISFRLFTVLAIDVFMFIIISNFLFLFAFVAKIAFQFSCCFVMLLLLLASVISLIYN